MKRLMKRMISFLLVFSMILTSFGVMPVQAEETEEATKNMELYEEGSVQEDVEVESTYDIPVTAAQIRRMWCTTNYNSADYVYVDSFLGYARVLYTRFFSSEFQSDVTDKVILTFEGRTRIANEKVAMAAIAITDSQAKKVESSVNTAKPALKITTEKTAAKADKLMTTTAGKYVDAVKNSVVAYGSAVSSDTAVTDNILNTFVYPVTFELDVTDIVKQAMESGDNVQFALLPAKDVMITAADSTTVNLGELDTFGEYKNGTVYSTEGEVLYENIAAASLDTSKTVCGKAGYYDGTINEANDEYFSWIYPVKSGAKLKVWRQPDEQVFADYIAAIESAADLEESFADISYLFDDALWADFEKVCGEDGIYDALYEAITGADLADFTAALSEIVHEYKNNSIYDIPAAAVQLRRMWCQTDYNSGDYTYSNDFIGYGRSLYTRFYNDEVQSEDAYKIVLSYEGRTRTANETVAMAVVAISDTQAKTVESSLTGSGSAFITASDKSTTTAQKLMTNTSGYYNNAVKDSVVAYGKATSADAAVEKNIYSNFVYPVTMEFDVTDAVKNALENGNHVQFALIPAKDIMIEDSNGAQVNIGKLADFGKYEDGKVYAADGTVLYNVPSASLDTSKTVCGSADYYAAETLNTKDEYFDWVYAVSGSIKLTAWTRTMEETFAAYAASVGSAEDVKATFTDISYLFDDTLWAQFEKVSGEDGIYEALYEAMKDADLASFSEALAAIVQDYYWGGYAMRVNVTTDLGGRRGTLSVDGTDIPHLAYAKAIVKDAQGNELNNAILTVKDGISYYNFYEVEGAANVEFVLFAEEALSTQLSKAAVVEISALNIPGVFITELSNQHARTYISEGESWGSDEQPFQYIELYNYTDTAVDLSEYTFVYNDHVGTHEFEWIKETNGSLMLEPGEIYMIGVYSADSAANGYAYDTDEALAAYWEGFNAFYSIDIPVTNRVLVACVASGDANTMLDGINHLERSYDAGVAVSAEIRKGSETVTKVNLAEKKPGNSYAFYFVPSAGDGVEEKRLFITGCQPGKLMAEQDVTYCEEVFLNTTDMLKVMSYNILATEKSASDNKTGLEIEEREDLLIEVLGNYQPDIIGLQEVNYRWAPLLQEDMPGAGYAEVQGYSSNGHTYANASGVWDLLNPIYYKADKFNLIESGAAYLTPDGNRTTKQWDTDNLKRTMTWVVLENKETKEIVNFINTHLVTKGKIARVEQVKLLCAKGAELLKNNGGGLVIVGDHNIYEGTEPYQVYVNSGVVKDTRFLTTNHTVISTISYGGQSHDKEYGSPIDLVMVAPETYFVNKYEVYTGEYPQGLLSDHSGVYVELYSREPVDVPDIPDVPEITAEDVIAMIDAIGPVSLEAEDKVKEAREAYDALAEEEKELVTNYTALTDAESALKELKASTNLFDKNSSDNWMQSLSYKGSQLTNTKNYANIFTTHKIDVSTGDTLYWGSFSKEDYVMEVYGSNNTYLGQVMSKNITSYDLGTTVLGVNDTVTNQYLYEAAITYTGASYVRILGNISTMDSYAVYKNVEGGWAKIIVSKIAAIGEVDLDKENAIVEARLFYDALTEEQKEQVTNYEVLTAAEAALEELKNQDQATYENLFDKSHSDNWFRTLSYNGEALFNEKNYANIFTTHPIEVVKGDTLFWGSFGKENYVMEIYDAEHKLVRQVQFTDVTYYSLGTTVAGIGGNKEAYRFEYTIADDNAAYVRILGNTSTIDTFKVFKNLEAAWPNRAIPVESILTGKSVLFVGDSITNAVKDNYKSGYGWAGRIGDLNDMNWTNAGVSGASASTCRSNNRVLSQLTKYSANVYDYVIMHAGVNDAMDSAAIGAVSASYEVEDFDISTYAGGLEEMFYYAKEYYPDALLGFIINYATPNSTWGGETKNMAPYFAVAKEVCDKWDIPYINLYDGTVTVRGEELSYSDDILQMNTTISLYNKDAGEVHIGGRGYDVISGYIADWMKTLHQIPEEPEEFAIVKQPENAVAKKGEDAVVTVEATGEGLTYTWYYKNPGNVKFYESGSQFVSEDGATYTIPMAAWRDGQEVYCVITDANGETLQSNTVALTMEEDDGSIVIVEQPKNITVISAYMHAVVDVKATGKDLTYTWYYKNPGNVKFYESGADFVNANQYVIEVAPWRDGQQVYCVITDANGNSVQTDTVTLSIAK